MQLLHMCRHVSTSRRTSLLLGSMDETGQESVNSRLRIFKLLRIDSKEPIPPGCVAWRAGTTTLFLLGSQPPYIV
jgi:hypothetical protein